MDDFIKAATQLTNTQSEWIDEKLESLMGEGINPAAIEIQFHPESEVRLVVNGGERYRWKPNFVTK